MVYCLFNVADGQFGIPVGQVKEVLILPPVRPLPEAPPFIEGVITVRRHIIAVIDLSKRFKICLTPEDNRKVLVVRVRKMILGLMVHDVAGVTELEGCTIDSVTNVMDELWTGKSVTGIAHKGNQSIILLDLDHMLDPEEHRALEKAGHENK